MSFNQDLGHAVRALRRSPLFMLTAVLSVAVGVAGATSVFSVADAMLLRPAPGIASPDRLIEVGRIESDGDFNTLSYPDYVGLRDRNTVLEGLVASDRAAFGLATSTDAIRVDGAFVSANYFGVLGVPLAIGRGFADQEERTSAQTSVAVISERIWHRLFDRDPRVVGRAIRLNGRPFSIVGVTGAEFAGTTIAAEDVWIPLAGYSEALTQRESTPLQAIGRLRPDVTLEVAQTHLQEIARDLPRDETDTGDPLRVALVPSDRIPESERDVVKTFIGLLFGMVGLLLLIACANVAGMLGARGIAREKEIGVRLALGAARGRLVRLLITESLVIGVAGAFAGIAGAFALTQVLRGILPVLPVSVSLDFGVDWRMMAFAVGLSLTVSVLYGILPAVQAARVDLASATRLDRSGGGSRRLRLRQAFVVSQVAVSVLLVVCAALLVRSVRNAAGIDPGFAAENVDLVEIDLRLGGYDDANGAVFAQELISEVQRLPGVAAAGATWIVPLQLRGTSTNVSIPTTGTEERRLTTLWNVVSPGYFETLGLPIVRGRAFVEADRAGSVDVAIVSETFAQRAWPGEDPIGRLLFDGDGLRTMQVVGVARDSKYRSISEAPEPFLYRPLSQNHQGELTFLMRRSGPSVITAARALLQQMDPNLPILRVATLADATAFSLFPRRLAMWTAASAGFVGLFLASLGLYGITAYEVTRRTREIGIRLAVGATPAAVLRMVVRQAMQLASTGALLGLVAAAGITQSLTIVLFRVEPLDPLSFAIGAVLFAIGAFAASLVPARRAAAADPVAALRAE